MLDFCKWNDSNPKMFLTILVFSGFFNIAQFLQLREEKNRSNNLIRRQLAWESAMKCADELHRISEF